VKFKLGGGWYTTIPFRFSTPGAIGENEVFSGTMPKTIYRIAKHLEAYGQKYQGGFYDNRNFFYGKSMKGAVIPAPHNQKKVRSSYGSFSSYEHKHSVYEGMTRHEEKNKGGRVSSKYMTFRRISDKTDPNAMIHPGFPPIKLAEKAMESIDIDIITENVAGNFL